MQTPLDIYRRFRIYRGLADHQLRVAAVGKYVADRMHTLVDTRLVVLACLFHDMGNIIKADLTTFPEFLEPEGIEYWRKVKEEFHARYNNDEHKASSDIVREIGLPADVGTIIDNLRFSRTPWVFEEGSAEQKICKYADLRVGPFGVLSVHERLAEARVRYAGKPYDVGESYDEATLTRIEGVCIELEKQLTTLASFNPAEITDVSIAPIVEELKVYSEETRR